MHIGKVARIHRLVPLHGRPHGVSRSIVEAAEWTNDFCSVDGLKARFLVMQKRMLAEHLWLNTI